MKEIVIPKFVYKLGTPKIVPTIWQIKEEKMMQRENNNTDRKETQKPSLEPGTHPDSKDREPTNITEIDQPNPSNATPEIPTEIPGVRVL